MELNTRQDVLMEWWFVQIYLFRKQTLSPIIVLGNERALTFIIHHIHVPMTLRLPFYIHLLSISDAGNSLYLLNYISTWMVTVHYAMVWPNEQGWKAVGQCSHCRWANRRKLIKGDAALCRLIITLNDPADKRLLSAGTRVINSVD